MGKKVNTLWKVEFYSDIISIIMIKEEKKFVAFTFDDGPSLLNDATLDILNVIKKYKIHATFFLIGQNVYNRPDVLKEMVSAQCEIGNHSWNHEKLHKIEIKKIKELIEKTQDIIEKNIGKRPILARTPGGEANPKILDAFKDESLFLINWSVDSRDWESRNKDIIVKKVLSEVKNGDIVLMHDVYNTSFLAFEEIVKELLKRNYEFVTVSELIKMKTPKLKNNTVYYSQRLKKTVQNKNKNYEKILLIGGDVDDIAYDENAIIEEKHKFNNADSMILLLVNKKNGKVKIVSFLRDIYVEILDKGYKKLNATLNIEGPELTVSTINKYFDLDIDKYVLIDMKNFLEVVDILGGIDINLTKDEVEYINKWVANVKLVTRTDKKTEILKKEGVNHLNGTQILAHVRNRTIGYCWERSNRQRETIKLILKKVKKTMNLFQTYQMIKKIYPYVKTNIKKTDILKYIILLFKVKIKNIETHCIPQEGTYKMVNDGIWRFELDFEKSKKLLYEFISNLK